MSKILNVDVKISEDIKDKWKAAASLIGESVEHILNKEDTVLSDDLNEITIKVRFLPQ